MDYQTIKQKLSMNLYKGLEDFKEDVLLVYDNCIKFNGPHSYVGNVGVKTKDYFLKIFGESCNKILINQ